jgi:hypothetical protein
MKSVFPRTLVLTALAVIIFTVGCTDRGDNYTMSGPTWQDNLGQSAISPLRHVFFEEMLVQINNPLQLMMMTFYTPDERLRLTKGPFPLLILLPPQDGDEFYYANHGLKEIADELIERGIIDPMVIVCIENDRTFGGYFYAGSGGGTYIYEQRDVTGGDASGNIPASAASGNYDAIVGDALIDYLTYTILVDEIIDDPARRGIGGVGMGAYGAFRAAMKHPGAFSSISAVDGPLDFDGPDGSSGLMTLVDQVFAEQGIPFGNETAYKNFDTLGSWHASRLFVGGSFAFSPLDTTVFVTVQAVIDDNTGAQTQRSRIDSTHRIDPTTAPTAITSLIRGTGALHFLLPFDANGNFVNDVWTDKWLPNNLENLYQTEPGAQQAIAASDIWFGSSRQARLGYHEMTQSWYNTIAADHPNSSQDTLVWFDYDGYAGYGASHDQYIYDLLREMLIFHDRSFKQEAQLP